MRRQGRVVEWNDEHGFGFAEPHEGGARVFVHVSAFGSRSPRPAVGDLITYSPESDERGRPRASRVRLVGKRKPARARGSAGQGISVFESILVLGYLAVLCSAVAGDRLHFAVPLGVILMSLVTYIVYGLDKSAARRGAWRTPESTLHFLALLGGWPGALVAQRRFRHKSRKAGFQAVFWATVVLNLISLVVLAVWF